MDGYIGPRRHSRLLSDLVGLDRRKIYTSKYMVIDDWERLTPKRKQHPTLGDDASTAEAAPGRVRRDEQGEARRAKNTPNGGPHLELVRLRLKTWYKSDLRDEGTAVARG